MHEISFLLHCFFVVSRLLSRNRMATMKIRQATQHVWPRFLSSAMNRLAAMKIRQATRYWFVGFCV